MFGPITDIRAFRPTTLNSTMFYLVLSLTTTSHKHVEDLDMFEKTLIHANPHNNYDTNLDSISEQTTGRVVKGVGHLDHV